MKKQCDTCVFYKPKQGLVQKPGRKEITEIPYCKMWKQELLDTAGCQSWADSFTDYEVRG